MQLTQRQTQLQSVDMDLLMMNKFLMVAEGLTDSDVNTAIGGLVSGKMYYVFGKTTNTFKLSESHGSCGDAVAVSLSSGATGTNHTFASLGIAGKGVV